jgi:glutathione synthase/RimK-type ligase-like ATP-grasp enzyme
MAPSFNSPDMTEVAIQICESKLEPIEATCSVRRRDPALIASLMKEATQTPDAANMCMKLHYIFAAYGQDASALQMQAKALEFRKLFRIVAPPQPRIKLLALVAAGSMMDNTPIDFLVEQSDIQVDLLYVDEHITKSISVPEHDLAFVALGESKKNMPILEALTSLMPHWPRPYINRPSAIEKCARDLFYELMKNSSLVRVPRTIKVGKEQVDFRGAVFTIRPIDTHAGEGFVKITSQEQLTHYLEPFESMQKFYVSQFIEYQSKDGLYRKYRIALIDSQVYICHLAISSDWIVHYFPSGMEHSAEKRQEEAQAMENFESRFARKHAQAFMEIDQAMGLDYVILDCAEAPNGELVVFEADPGAWIHATDPRELFPYKPAIMQKAFDAFRRLLIKRASLSFT